MTDIDPSTIPESEYVTVSEQGHLQHRGKRARYWASIGATSVFAEAQPDDSAEEVASKVERMRKGNERVVQRLIDTGFNAIRYWRAVPDGQTYTKGDGSEADSMDHWISVVKERGLKIWCAGLNQKGNAKPEDVTIVDDPDTADAWQAMVRKFSFERRGVSYEGEMDLRNNVALIFDERLEKIALRDMKNIAQHYNQYTGLRWADDPVFAVWEISNEEWWMRRIQSNWHKMPDYHRNLLIQKWNAYLVKKYGSTDALSEAWKGLLPDEDPNKGSVIFAPTQSSMRVTLALNDGSEHVADVSKTGGNDQSYSREDFDPQRGRDILEFLTGLLLGHKRRCHNEIKSWGRSTALCPLLHDTGIGYNIQMQYVHQNADAVSHDAYSDGWNRMGEMPLEQAIKGQNPFRAKLATLEWERNQTNEGSWINWLLKPPGLCSGVPWLEHNKVEGKPYLVYETQIQQPAKYRADYPIRIATLGAIQDWDWVSWHYNTPSFGLMEEEEKPWEKPMDITVGSHPQGYHHTYDEVQTSAMKAAGAIFINGSLKQAETPTKFIYGRKSLYHPDSMDYAGSYGDTGLDMLQTTYQYGVRIEMDPTREEDQVIGPVVSFNDRNTHNPYTPTDEIVMDWKKGYIAFDSECTATFTGYLGEHGNQYKFSNGVTLSDVNIHNPAGMWEDMDNERQYIAFSLYPEAGQADATLADANKLCISLVSGSWNTGFELASTISNGKPMGSIEGQLPVLVARVSGTVTADCIAGMRYTFYDWNMQPFESGAIEGNSLTIPSDKPIFYVELTR